MGQEDPLEKGIIFFLLFDERQEDGTGRKEGRGRLAQAHAVSVFCWLPILSSGQTRHTDIISKRVRS